MAKIAILGDGQLGQLTALAAQEMGHETMVFGDVGLNSPAGQVSPYTEIPIKEKFNSEIINTSVGKLLDFEPDVATIEWENVPANFGDAAEEAGIIMRPGAGILRTIQDRKTEKEAIISSGHETVGYEDISSESKLRGGFAKYGPGIIKTRREGYDGKGQFRINSIKDIDTFVALIESGIEKPFCEVGRIYEELVNFSYELSVTIARNPRGQTIIFEPAHNTHEKGILDTSFIPALHDLKLQGKITQEIVDDAKRIAHGIANHMGLVGEFTVEMFVVIDENGKLKLIVNELAPRPHNSGHGSIESYSNVNQYSGLIMAILDQDMPDAELTNGSLLRNMMGNDIKEMPQRNRNGNFKIVTEGDTTYYDYGKGINNPDGDSSPTRKCGHKTKVVPLK